MKTRARNFKQLMVSVLLLCTVITGCAQQKNVRTASEKLLSKIEGNPVIQVSPNGRRFAYVLTDGNKSRVVIDGVKSKKYNHVVSYIRFSPDSKRIAYGAMVGDAAFVVLDGKEKKKYDSVCVGFRSRIHFSPDSRRIAYVAARREEKIKRNRSDTESDAPTFKSFVVIDGKEEKEYDSITGLTFSQNSKRLGYIAKTGLKEHQFGTIEPDWEYKKEFVVIDGVEHKEDDKVRSLVFSADGKHFAYAAGMEPDEEDANIADYDWCIVLDGNESKKYDEVSDPVFSPDGRHFAYSVDSGQKGFIVFDGKEQKKYNGSISPRLYPAVVFSPDSKHFAYAAYHDGEQLLILDGRETKCHCDPMYFIFSPDGKRHAFRAYKGGLYILVLDGKELPGGCCPVFSANSKRFAYVSGRGTTEFAIVDGKKHKQYDGLGHPVVFSPDSKHVVYWAEADDKAFVVVDGKEGKKYDRVLEPIVFDSDNTFHYLAVRNNKVYLVEEKLK